jgi:hypothetical protein
MITRQAWLGIPQPRRLKDSEAPPRRHRCRPRQVSPPASQTRTTTRQRAWSSMSQHTSAPHGRPPGGRCRHRASHPPEERRRPGRTRRSIAPHPLPDHCARARRCPGQRQRRHPNCPANGQPMEYHPACRTGTPAKQAPRKRRFEHATLQPGISPAPRVRRCRSPPPPDDRRPDRTQTERRCYHRPRTPNARPGSGAPHAASAPDEPHLRSGGIVVCTGK